MPTIEEAQDFIEQLRSSALDIRVEAILSDLVASGYSFDDFIVRPVGLFARNYRSDVGEVRTEKFKRRVVPKLVIEVHREGLYDALPEELFHHPLGYEFQQDRQVVTENMREQRRKEWSARQFFLPFEQEFYYQRVVLELLERRYFTNLPAYWNNELLANFWGLAKGLPSRQIVNLLYLLPLAHRIIGDMHLTLLCFESILEQSVSLRTIAPLSFSINTSTTDSKQYNEDGLKLGQIELGRDFVLSGSYQETLPAIEIQLESLSSHDLGAFLATDTWQVKALQLLCDYFIPFETDIVVRYQMAEHNQAFVLSDVDEAPVLGFAKMQL